MCDINIDSVLFHGHETNRITNHDIRNRFNYSGLRLKLLRKKRNFLVNDGNVKLTISLDNLRCNLCKSYNCKHINFILNKHYNINNNILPMIDVKGFSFSCDTFKQDVEKYFKEFECCVCFFCLERDSHFWICKSCKQIMHLSCIEIVKKKKSECPLCKADIVL